MLFAASPDCAERLETLTDEEVLEDLCQHLQRSTNRNGPLPRIEEYAISTWRADPLHRYECWLSEGRCLKGMFKGQRQGEVEWHRGSRTPPPPRPFTVPPRYTGTVRNTYSNPLAPGPWSATGYWVPGTKVRPVGGFRGWPAGFNRTWVRRTYRLGVLIGSAYFRPAESPAVPSARRLGRPKVRFNPSPPLVLLPPNTNTLPPIITNKSQPPPPFWHTTNSPTGPYGVKRGHGQGLGGGSRERSTVVHYTAVHTEGGAHTRRDTQKAVCGHRRSHVIKGATGKAVHTDGGAHTRRNTQKAVCGHRRSHVMKGATGKAVHTEGGAHTRRNTQKAVCGHRRSHVIKGATGKAVHTQGGTHKKRSVATVVVMLLKGPQARRYTQKAVHTQGRTHKRRSVATAGVLFLIYRGGGGVVSIWGYYYKGG